MRLLSVLAVVSSSLWATSALAQQAAPLPPLPPASAPEAPPPVAPAPAAAPPPVVRYEAAPPVIAAEESEETNALRARTGFQMALRTGWAMPMGDAVPGNGGAMSDNFGGQVPLIIDIGGKLSPHVFLGGYLGLGLGGAAGATDRGCTAFAASCASATFRIGAQVQYHFAPGDTINPWIGYGIGLESSAVSSSGGSGADTTVALVGPEYAHLMAGFDYRVSHGFGIGPVIDYSLGSYVHESVTVNNRSSDGDINQTSSHQWLMLGVRVVFFP